MWGRSKRQSWWFTAIIMICILCCVISGAAIVQSSVAATNAEEVAPAASSESEAIPSVKITPNSGLTSAFVDTCPNISCPQITATYPFAADESKTGSLTIRFLVPLYISNPQLVLDQVKLVDTTGKQVPVGSGTGTSAHFRVGNLVCSSASVRNTRGISHECTVTLSWFEVQPKTATVVIQGTVIHSYTDNNTVYALSPSQVLMVPVSFLRNDLARYRIESTVNTTGNKCSATATFTITNTSTTKLSLHGISFGASSNNAAANSKNTIRFNSGTNLAGTGISLSGLPETDSELAQQLRQGKFSASPGMDPFTSEIGDEEWIDAVLWNLADPQLTDPVIPIDGKVKITRPFARTACTPGRDGIVEPGQEATPKISVMASAQSETDEKMTLVASASVANRLQSATNVGLLTTHGIANKVRIWRWNTAESKIEPFMPAGATGTGSGANDSKFFTVPDVANSKWDKVDWVGSSNNTWMAYYPSQDDIGSNTGKVNVYDMFPLVNGEAPIKSNEFTTSLTLMNRSAFDKGSWNVSYGMQPNGVLWMAQYGTGNRSSGKLTMHMWMLHYYDKPFDDIATRPTDVGVTELSTANLLVDGNEIGFARWEYHGDVVFDTGSTGDTPWVRGFTISETNGTPQFVFNVVPNSWPIYDVSPSSFMSGLGNENVLVSLPISLFPHLYVDAPETRVTVNLPLNASRQVTSVSANKPDGTALSSDTPWWATSIRSTAASKGSGFETTTVKYIGTGKLGLFGSFSTKDSYVIPLNFSPAQVPTFGWRGVSQEVDFNSKSGMVLLSDSYAVYGGGSLFNSVQNPVWDTQLLDYGIRAVLADGSLSGSEDPAIRNNNIFALGADRQLTAEYRLTLANHSLSGVNLDNAKVTIPLNITLPEGITAEEVSLIIDDPQAENGRRIQQVPIPSSGQTISTNVEIAAPAVDTNIGAYIQVKARASEQYVSSQQISKCVLDQVNTVPTGGIMVQVGAPDEVGKTSFPANVNVRIRQELGEKKNGSAARVLYLDRACVGVSSTNTLTIQPSGTVPATGKVVVAYAKETMALGQQIAGKDAVDVAAALPGQVEVARFAGADTTANMKFPAAAAKTYLVRWFNEPSSTGQPPAMYTAATGTKEVQVNGQATANLSFSETPLFDISIVPRDPVAGATQVGKPVPLDSTSSYRTDYHLLQWKVSIKATGGAPQKVPSGTKVFVMPSTPGDQNVYIDRYSIPVSGVWNLQNVHNGERVDWPDGTESQGYSYDASWSTHYPSTSDGTYLYTNAVETTAQVERSFNYYLRVLNNASVNAAEGRVSRCTVKDGKLVYDDTGVLGNLWISGVAANPYQDLTTTIGCIPIVEKPDLAISVHDEDHQWAEAAIGHPINVHPVTISDSTPATAKAAMVFRVQMINTGTQAATFKRSASFTIPQNSSIVAVERYTGSNSAPTEDEMTLEGANSPWAALTLADGKYTVDFGQIPALSTGTKYLRVRLQANDYTSFTKQEDLVCQKDTSTGAFVANKGLQAIYTPTTGEDDGSSKNNTACYTLIGETSGAPFIVRTVDAENNYVDGSKFKLYNATIDAQGVITADSEVTDPWVRIYGKNGNLLWCATGYCPDGVLKAPESYDQAIQHAGAVKTKDLTFYVPYLLVQTQVPVGLPLPPQLLPEGVLLQPTGSQLWPYDRTQNQWVDPGHTNTAIVDGGIVKVHVGPLATGTTENSLLPAANAAEAKADDTVTPIWQVDIRNPLAGELPVAGGRGPLPIVFAGLILVAAGMLARRRLVRL